LNNDLLFETSFSALYASKLGNNLHNLSSKINFNAENISKKIETLPDLIMGFSNEIYEIGSKLSDVYKKTTTVKSIIQSLFLSREFIYKNYREKITLNDLVRTSSLSKYHLLRLFSKAFDISPQQMQHNLRIRDAILMIKMQSYSLTEIAFTLGYTDLASFSNNFKAHLGFSPSKYLNSL